MFTLETLMSWLPAVVAAVLLFLTAWIVLPGWTYTLLSISVGATEYCAWLLLASAAVGAMTAAVAAPRLGTILPIVSVAALLAMWPLLQAPGAIRRFDAEMARGLGAGALVDASFADRHAMRPRPIVALDLFRGIDADRVTIAGGIEFAAPKGQRLTATVYRPASEGRYPTVVQIYGGAWQRGAPDDDPVCARYLASRGYVVFAIDYRHAPQWPWPAQRDDVRTALVWIRGHGAEYGADVSRLVLMGRSAGAHLAMIAAYEPDAAPVRGVISYYGPVDLADGYRHPPRPDPLDVRAIDEALLTGTPDTVPDRYRDASPVSYVTRRLPPTLLVYGARDHIVEARYGRMLYERLRATGTTSILLEIPWAEHAFDAVPHGPSGQLALYYTERFLASVASEGSPQTDQHDGTVGVQRSFTLTHGPTQ